MKLDLSKDKAKILKYLRRRIKDYPHHVNNGPGKDSDPIRLVTLGFYAEQGGYVALVFDTRKEADYDGEWTLFIDELTMLDFPKWCDFYELACNGKPVELVQGNGESLVVHFEDANEDHLIDDKSLTQRNDYFGSMLTDVMKELRNDGSWKKVPLSDDAFMMVSDFDENYLWPNYEKRKSSGRIAN